MRLADERLGDARLVHAIRRRWRSPARRWPLVAARKMMRLGDLRRRRSPASRAASADGAHRTSSSSTSVGEAARADRVLHALGAGAERPRGGHAALSRRGLRRTAGAPASFSPVALRRAMRQLRAEQLVDRLAHGGDAERSRARPRALGRLRRGTPARAKPRRAASRTPRVEARHAAQLAREADLAERQRARRAPGGCGTTKRPRAPRPGRRPARRA